MAKEPEVLGPAIVMIIISILLFWLPGFGPLIAGYVGGRMAGTPGAAFSAALAPMVLAGVFVFLALTMVGLPFVGVLAAGGVVIYIAILEIALIAGALIGGILASN